MLSLINYVLETARIESGNSLKYTPAGGKITIDIREIPFDRENYIAYKIVVEDTGIGMSEDYLPHIFEEFSREHTATENKVSGFNVNHQGKRDESSFVIGTLATTNGNFRVNCFLKKVENQYLIHQIRIDKINE